MDESHTVRVAYPAERSADEWAHRHNRGEVPDLWPYGLDQLRSHAGDVECLNVEPLSAFDRLRCVAPRFRNRHSRSSTSIAWDEGTAARLLAADNSDSRFYSGVIWAPDDIVRGTNRLRTRALQSVLKKFDGVWCLSRVQVEPIIDWLKLPPSAVRFIQFGVDNNFFRTVPYSETKTVLSLGNDVDRDYSTLFKAFDLVSAARPATRFIVQGHQAHQKTWNSKIEFMPRMPHLDVKRLYGESAIVAVATRDNLHASGMTVCLEAMASGRPVVMTNTPGIGDYVAEGVDGRLVTVGDYRAMADSIIEYLDDPSLAEVDGRRGRERIDSVNNTMHMSEQLWKFFLDSENE